MRNELRRWAGAQSVPAYDRRSGSGALRNLVVREGRRTGQLQSRLVTSPTEIPRPPVDLHTIVEGDEQQHRAAGVLGAPEGGALLQPAGSGFPQRVLPDQHGDGGTALHDRGGDGGPERRRARLRPLRNRRPRLAASPGAPAGCGDRDRHRRDREREKNARINGVENAHFQQREEIRPTARRSRRPDVVVVDPPAGLRQEGRPQADRVRRPAHCLRLLQSDNARSEHSPSSRRPAIGCGG